MTRLQHCAFVAVTIVALGTTITSLSHPRGRDAPLDVPELELHTPPHPGDPIGFDANGTECLFEANLDALGAYRDAYVEKKLPLCPTTSAGRRMQDGGFFGVVTSASILPYCDVWTWENGLGNSFTVVGERPNRQDALRSCRFCRCRFGWPSYASRWGFTGGECGGISGEGTYPFTCEGGQLEIRGEKFFCNAGCSLMHGCTAV
jgi:hypothetical protein